jgi:uncharacterized protein (TIGR02145 family)
LSQNQTKDDIYYKIIKLKTNILASSLFSEIELLLKQNKKVEARKKCYEYLKIPNVTEHSTYNIIKSATEYLPVNNGVFTDVRDGNIYGWVQIGNQIWMSENIKYKTKNSKTGIAGEYYKWKETENVCPSGWHLPSANEYYELKNTLSGNADTKYKQLFISKDTTDLFSNLTGFSAVRGGIYDSGTGTNGISKGWKSGEWAMWWTSLSVNMMNAHSYVFKKESKNVFYWQHSAKSHYMPVRCIKNK